METSSQLTRESSETNNETMQVCMAYGTGHMYRHVIVQVELVKHCRSCITTWGVIRK